MSAPQEPKQGNQKPDTSEQLEVNEPQGTEPAAEPVAEDEGLVQFGAPAGEDLEAQLSAAQEEIARYHEELLRARAEVENVRRRAQEDVIKARKFGTEAFAESLIPVRDSLEAALALTEQTAEAWKEGVEATLRQLNGAFERNQMREVAPAPGDKFDPHFHQAISNVPSDLPSGTVVQLLQKGYTLADRVLRPALVTVSAGQA
ncbi:nucleotide exchange factor GrpE [Yanghanlia caeni]|uniref:Protein GrpE n=1 Tax=Yanghanlia caeni TaxID=3064283 RepID=A0ABU1D8V8_9BURK|nr:nucleotide exchange factor GrpE [Alcaligenaceae bacterium LG-2]NGR09230.1 nucleotide exchange factor GrpE [bacterium SGD-2]HZH57836.1 nucleotide exchange factor GrpE [Burkholderiaceae bacterium]